MPGVIPAGLKMPHSEHRIQCIHCGRYYNCGDCITFTCYECGKSGHYGLSLDCPVCCREAEARRARIKVAIKMCSATYELLNGEHVSPCHLLAGHDGNHEGYVLGSRCTWSQGSVSEFDEWDAKLDAINQELEGMGRA